MPNGYDHLADDYDLSFKHLPLRRHVEQHSVMEAVGDVAGLDVLDVACGTGHYARIAKRTGAKRVVGVDLSGPMIGMAQGIEAQTELGIEYHVADATTLPSLGSFDLGLAVYMLHYASSVEMLQGMCGSLAAALEPGARLVGFVMNPEVATDGDAYAQYGMTLRVPDPLREGGAVHFALKVPDVPPVEITAYRWSRPTYENALHDAGFEGLEWQRPTVSEAGEREHGAAFWQPYLERPHCLVFSAKRRD